MTREYFLLGLTSAQYFQSLYDSVVNSNILAICSQMCILFKSMSKCLSDSLDNYHLLLIIILFLQKHISFL